MLDDEHGGDLPTRPTRGIAFRLVTVIGVSMICLIALELILQAGALAVSLVRDEPDRGAGGAYIIVCLGESTTEGYGETSYPELLQRRLESLDLGVEFGVVNAGFVAETSPVLAERLEALIEQYQPRMVITMMGVNDGFYFGDTERLGLGVNVQLALLRLRTYRLARLAWSAVREEPRDPAYSTPPVELQRHYAEFTERYWDVNARFYEGQPVADEFRALIRDAREVGRPGPAGTPAITLVDAYRIYVYSSYSALTELLLADGRGDEALELYHEALESHPDVEFFVRSLAGVYEDLGRLDEAAVASRDANRLARAHVLEVTRRSHRRVERTARDHGIELVAMQYPMRRVEELRFLFDDSDYPRYVDQGPAFRRQVREVGYDALFVDRFAGDFGHCTERGNRLIVDELVRQVFEPMFAD